MQSNN